MRALLFALLAIASAKIYFQEEFTPGWEKRWVKSTLKEKEGTQGEWGLEAGNWYGNKDEQMGLKTMQDARFYGISADMGEPFSNKGKDLIVSFTVKHEQKLDCGGGYLKILPAGLKQDTFGGDDKYNIMFGPDICGTGTRKVHLIFNYKGTNYLIKKTVPCKTDQLTHTYTMILHPDNTYEIQIDEEKVQAGKLDEDWDMLKPKEIPDPAAKKPEDWVDEPEMDDPTDKKPEDWDKEPANIPDPEAQKPETWDDEEDGEWVPPQIPNPNFKGEWKVKRIPNPNYKGVWKAPMIPNPEYVADDNLYLQDDMKYVGMELWQVKSGSIFDNFLVTDSLDELKDFVARTWKANKDGEKAMFDKLEEEKRQKEEEERKKEEEERKQREAEEAAEKEEEEEEEKQPEPNPHDDNL